MAENHSSLSLEWANSAPCPVLLPQHWVLDSKEHQEGNAVWQPPGRMLKPPESSRRSEDARCE